MRKMVLIVVALFAACAVFANAGVFRGNGDTPRVAKTDAVQMVEEDVTMTLIRGNYPIDGRALNQDRMKYHCKFLLRNLTDKEVALPVGFPLSGAIMFLPRNKKYNQTELLARFGFVAGTADKVFPVKYVPWEKNKKFSKIFLWDMTFKPHEEITLYVCYTMGGYMGLGSTQKQLRFNPDKYKCPYFMELAFGVAEGHSYVTGTGGCWAKKIEKATFRIYLGDFEEYLDKRGAFEGSSYTESKSEEWKKHHRVFHHRIRVLKPAEGWRQKSDKRRRTQWLELTKSPFEPKEKDAISLFYIWTIIPFDLEGFKDLLCKIRYKMDRQFAQREKMIKEKPEFYKKNKKRWDNVKPFDDSVTRNLADVTREFYGIKTGNTDIQDFLGDQIWYPVKNPPEIDPQLKAYLMQKKIAFPDNAWRKFLEAQKLAEEKRKKEYEALRKKFKKK